MSSGCFGLKQWLSTKGSFASWGDIGQYLETFWVITAEGREELPQHNKESPAPGAKVSGPGFNGVQSMLAARTLKILVWANEREWNWLRVFLLNSH